MFQPRLVNKISRLGNHTLWGDQQPATYRLTDIGLYRPVELGYEILFARFNIWDLRVHGLSQNTEGATSTSVLNHLLNLGEVSTPTTYLCTRTCA